MLQFKGSLAGKHVYIIGKGPSSQDVPPDFIHRIGVNDVETNPEPGVPVDDLVLVDMPHAYAGERLANVIDTKAKRIFVASYSARTWATYLDNTRMHTFVAEQLARRSPGIPDIEVYGPQEPVFPCFNGTPFVAVTLATYFGATKITLYGVDYTGGSWSGGCKLESVRRKFKMLRYWCEQRHVHLRCANETSKLADILDVAPTFTET